VSFFFLTKNGARAEPECNFEIGEFFIAFSNFFNVFVFALAVSSQHKLTYCHGIVVLTVNL